MNDQVEEVKGKTDIVAVIGRYVSLKKAGRHFKGLCPFHSEKTPSFTVNEELGLYKCFGCGAGGDVIKFLMEIEGSDFVDVLKGLAEKAGVRLEMRGHDIDSGKKELLEIMDLAARYYHWLLMESKSGEEARDYLGKRKVGKKLIETFTLGYSLPEWDGLIEYLTKKKKYSISLLERAGLVTARSRGGFFDKFRGRVMFPLHDTSGRVVGFAGRILPAIAKEGEPKYLNSPETEIYHKGKILYGFFQAKQAIREKRRVVLVEGQMDMISSFGAGVAETVAVGGTSLTDNQVEMLARLGDTILLSLDADDAGTAAIKRSADLAEKRGLNIKVVQVIGGKDPDEIARNNPNVWKEMIESAMDIYEFVMTKSLEKNDITSAVGIKKVTEEVLPFFIKIENRVVREVWLKRLSEKLGVGMETMKAEMERWQRGLAVEVKHPMEKETIASVMDSKVDRLGKRLIAGLIVCPGTRGKLREWVERVPLEGAVGKAVVWLVMNREEEIKTLFIQAPAELKTVMEESYLAGGDSGLVEKDVMAVMSQFLREAIRVRRGGLIEEMRRAKEGGNEAREEELSTTLRSLDRDENGLLVSFS